MISYKVKGIILAVILSLASIMMPFSVYADTLTTSNITYNYYLSDVVDSTSQLANKDYIYDVDFLFDKSYLGWVSVSMITSYVYATGDTRQATYTKAIYVNGNTAKTSIVVSSNYTGTNGSPLTSMSITVNNSNVIPLADLSSLEDIINLLQDIDDHISIDLLQELENIVSNTSLANDYLEKIYQLRQWNIPFESINYLYPFFTYENRKIIDLYNDGYNMIFPIIELKQNQTIINHFHKNYYSPAVCLFYFYTDSNGTFGRNNITTYNVSSYDFEIISSILVSGGYMYLVKLSNIVISSGYARFVYTGSYDTKFIPIYMNNMNNKNISTDFALKYGLTNRLLDDLHIIAEGNNQSNSAASNLENEASEYSEIADDVIGVEEGLTSNFETEVNKIDLNTGLNVFGGNFMTSATWVRTQFDRLTENTPYGSLIIYGLTLGFALLMLGKVFL